MSRAGLLLALWLGCLPALSEERSDVIVPGWIALTAPPGFSLDKAPNELLITETGAVRTPLRIKLHRGRKAAALIGQSRMTPTGAAVFTITKEKTGASGGPEWMLQIVHPLATILATQQREHTAPDFAEVWGDRRLDAPDAAGISDAATRAFSSQSESDWRRENATTQGLRAPDLMQSGRNAL